MGFAHELALGDVYFSPLLLVIVLAFFAATFTALLFNKIRLSAYVIYPPLSFIAIVVIYVVMIDRFFIKI